ncbi:hypothetical protein BgAZ_403460 [Babesia gibsoni]|uniref:RRP12 HEAT domain-containing protein n=1 Tax=Babesia gibsoni TaxID=33632 RepID=A0AAD8LP46_BABGI|nr:hypothetical protein BgAZ_403460 [Babesia gibsoni]
MSFVSTQMMESSYMVDNLVRRLRQSIALGSDSIPHHCESEIDDSDIAIYEEYISSGRFMRLKKCALDSLGLIREAVEPVNFTWNPGIADVEKEAILELYPIAKCALHCIYNQLDDVLENAASYKEASEDSSTLTFEGLFLIVKTILEMLDPVVFALEMSIFTMLLKVMERTRPLRPLLNACLGCISTYLCRLFSSDISHDIQEGMIAILSKVKQLFEQVLELVLANDDERLNADALTFLKMVTSTIIQRLHTLTSGHVDECKRQQINFVVKVIDCWYGVLVGRIMQLRLAMQQSSTRPVKLVKLLKAIITFPPLPPAHRLRVVLQVALTLRQDATCSIQVEALSAIIALMEIDPQEKSDIMRNNARPLSEALIEVLFDTRYWGNSHGAISTTDCEKQVQLVYCIAQCIRVARSIPAGNASEHVDEFLQGKIFSLLNSESAKPADGSARIDRMIRETEMLPELNSNFPTLKDFMAARDDCDLLTRLMKMFNYLLTYCNHALDEAIALVLCWLFQEFDLSLCLKIVAPICLQFLRTKRSKMLDEIHKVSSMPSGLAAIAQSTMSRWTVGGKIFSTALEAYRGDQSDEDMGVSVKTAYMKPIAIFDALFDATIDIVKEAGGAIPKDLEDCIGLYVKMFGIETYLRLLPLNTLYTIPITSEIFKVGAHAYMLPILHRQLKGVDMSIYVLHFLPVLQQVELLEKRAKELVSMNTSAEPVVSHASRSYESLVEVLYSIAITMVSASNDCKEALEMNDFQMLKHVLALLDRGTTQAIIAGKFIAACANLEGIAPNLIGLLVKRFVALQTTMGACSPELQSTFYVVEDALLAAISNCGKFCDSKMLAVNLSSFEEALKQTAANLDSSVKISRALLPSVDDELKLQLHKHWLELLTAKPSKSLYLALKRSCETASAKLELLLNEPDSTRKGLKTKNENVDSLFVRELCSLDGLKALANTLHLAPGEKPKEETEEHSKHRVCCISAFVHLLETMKKCDLYRDVAQQIMVEIVKTLIMEAMVNVTAPNNNTRSSAMSIYDSVCNLMIEEMDTVIRLSLSALTCGDSKNMQISFVICLTRLIALHSDEAMKFNLAQVLSYIFRLLSEDNIKLYVQILRFARVCIVKFTRDRVQWLAPLLMRMFDNESCCARARVFVRRITQKLLQKLTRDQLMKIFPPQHLPLLRSIMTARRKKRNVKLRKALRAGDEEDDQEFVDKMFKTDDEGRLVVTMDEEEEIEEEDDTMDVNNSASRKEQKKVRQKTKKKSDIQPYAYIKLNKAKASEKHKKENIRALQAIVRNKGSAETV